MPDTEGTCMDDDTLFHAQVALVLTACACSPDEHSAQHHLTAHLNLHNISQFSLQRAPPIKHLIAVTDGRLQTAVECKTILKLVPTLYLVLGEYLPPPCPTGDASKAQHLPGLAVHYSSMQDNLPLPDAPQGSRMHGLASWVASQVPLHSLFNYLGQGYQIVFAGHGFGGVVAHALAVRLLMEVRQEIQQAQSLGINLSGLAQTEDKVSSFAFASPLMANSTIADTLHQQGLTKRMHTIWRSRDASPHFFTACSELATTADGVLPANDYSPPSLTSVPFQLKTANFQAANTAATAIATEVAANKAARKPGHQRPVCVPLDLSNTTSTHISSTQADFADAPAPRSGSSLSGKLSAPRSSDAGAQPLVKSISKGDSSPGTLSRASSKVTLRASEDRPSGNNTGSPKPHRLSHTATDRKTAKPPQPATAVAGDSSVAAAASGTGWKAAVKALLGRHSGVEGSCRYAPLGTFWLLDAPPATKPGGPAKTGQAGALVAATSAAAAKASGKAAVASAAPSVRMVKMSAAKVLGAQEAWLSENNPEFINCWEWSLEEFQKDAMEAFAWVTFKPTVKVDNGLVNREALIKPSKSLCME